MSTQSTELYRKLNELDIGDLVSYLRFNAQKSDVVNLIVETQHQKTFKGSGVSEMPEAIEFGKLLQELYNELHQFETTSDGSNVNRMREILSNAEKLSYRYIDILEFFINSVNESEQLQESFNSQELIEQKEEALENLFDILHSCELKNMDDLKQKLKSIGYTLRKLRTVRDVDYTRLETAGWVLQGQIVLTALVSDDDDRLHRLYLKPIGGTRAVFQCYLDETNIDKYFPLESMISLNNEDILVMHWGGIDISSFGKHYYSSVYIHSCIFIIVVLLNMYKRGYSHGDILEGSVLHGGNMLIKGYQRFNIIDPQCFECKDETSKYQTKCKNWHEVTYVKNLYNKYKEEIIPENLRISSKYQNDYDILHNIHDIPEYLDFIEDDVKRVTSIPVIAMKSKRDRFEEDFDPINRFKKDEGYNSEEDDFDPINRFKDDEGYNSEEDDFDPINRFKDDEGYNSEEDDFDPINRFKDDEGYNSEEDN
jgi:hypothetical protein